MDLLEIGWLPLQRIMDWLSPTVAENDIDEVVNAMADFKKKRGVN